MKPIRFRHPALMKTTWITVGVLVCFAVVGCKPKEQVIANKVVESEQALITGQIFVVTKGRANVVLGDEKVALLDANATRAYFNSKAIEWSNALAMAQGKIETAFTNNEAYAALFDNDLAKFTTAKKYHENIMAYASAGSPEWNQAFEWSKKLDEKIADLRTYKTSSDARKQLDDAVNDQSDLWDKINWPSAKYFEPRIDITTTDSEGRFKFIVPKSLATSNLMLFATADRQVGDDKEKYWWMVEANLNGKKTAEFVLSNDNKGSGSWLCLDNHSVREYMIDYIEKIRRGKFEREMKAIRGE